MQQDIRVNEIGKIGNNAETVGILIYAIVAFGTAFILDYTIIIRLMHEKEWMLLPLLLLRMAAPSLGAVVTWKLLRLDEKWKTSLREAIKLKLPQGDEWVFVFLIPPGIIVTSYILATFTLRVASLCHTCSILGEDPIHIMIFSLYMLVLGVIAGVTVNMLAALLEEIGWRGLLYTLIRRRIGDWRLASVIVGVFWGLWHAPLIWEGYNFRVTILPGVCETVAPKGVISLAVFTIFTVSLGVVLVWLVERSGTLLSAAAGHGCLNGIAGLFVMLCIGDTTLTPPTGLVVSTMIMLTFTIAYWVLGRR